MVKHLLLLSIFFSNFTFAAGSYPSTGMSVYMGTAQGLGFPKSFRFYWNEIEFGTYPTSFGVVKVFSDGNFYADFGAAYAQQGTGDFGFLAGVGYHKIMGLGFGFRADWCTFAGLAGYQNTDVQIGFTFNF